VARFVFGPVLEALLAGVTCTGNPPCSSM